MSTDPKCSGAKKCIACQVEKPAIFFASDRRRADGIKDQCRECDQKRAAEGRKQTKSYKDDVEKKVQRAIKRLTLAGRDPGRLADKT